MIDSGATRAHHTADASPATLELLADLRRALVEGRDRVTIPTVLGSPEQGTATVRAGLVRRRLLGDLEALVGSGQVPIDDARLLVERFALDGELRASSEVQQERAIGRETMRLRYRAALERLADRLTSMPLALDPPVGISTVGRELVLARAFASRRTNPEDLARESYVQARVRHQLLGSPAPAPPRQGRAEDRRWQREGDRLRTRIEHDIDGGDAGVPKLDLLGPAERARAVAWIQDGRPLDRAGPALSAAVLSAWAHGEIDEQALVDEDDPFAFEALVADVAIDVALRVLVTSRERLAATPIAGLQVQLHLAVAEALAVRGFAAAAEHVVRACGAAMRDDVGLGTATRVRFFEHRLHQRVALHLGRGPGAIDPLRATVRAFTTLHPHVSYERSVRVLSALLDVEIAAALAGASPTPGQRTLAELRVTFGQLPGERLDPGVERSLRRRVSELGDLQSGRGDRVAAAERLATRLSGPALESKVAARLTVGLWVRPT